MASSFIAMLGNTELILILAIVVIVFGVGKLPQVGRQLGEGIKNFKREVAAEKAAELAEAEAALEPRDVTEQHPVESR